jgi:hypothetical protein
MPIKIESISSKEGTSATSHKFVAVPQGALIVVTTTSETSNRNSSISSSPTLVWEKTDASKQNSGDAETFTAIHTSGGTLSITSNWGSNTYQTSVAYVITGALPTVAPKTIVKGQGAPSASITASNAGSILICVTSDWNAVDGKSRIYRDGAVEQFYGTLAKRGTAYHYIKQVFIPGIYTEGLTSPNVQNSGTIVLNISPSDGVAPTTTTSTTTSLPTTTTTTTSTTTLTPTTTTTTSTTTAQSPTTTTTTSTTTAQSPTTTTTTTSTTTNSGGYNLLIEGYGSQAIGGANSATIYHVTNLNASGPGSLAAGIGSNKTIIFDVSGTINARLTISGVSYLTIDAYSNGKDITIDNGNNGDALNVDNSDHIIIRGLRFINAGNDGLNVTNSAHDVAFDHCSAYGNRDGNIDVTAVTGKNFTVQYCILGNNQGAGNMLITTINASIHHNLFIGDGAAPDGQERNPYAHSNYSPKGSQSNPNFDFRNNLIHASGRYASGDGYGAVGNFINNYYTSNKAGLINLCADPASCSSAYVSGNFNQPSATGGTSLSSACTIPVQYQIATTDATTAAQLVLQKVGPYVRSAYETSVINSIVISGNPTTTTTTSTTQPVGTTTTTTSTTTKPATTTTTTSTTTQPTPGYTLTYQNNFNVPADVDSNQLGRGGLSSNQSVSGGFSFRSEVRAGDAPISSGWRSEQQYDGANQNPTEGAVEYDVYYENWGNFDGGGHSVQWHPNTSGGSAIISLQNYSSTWDVTRDPNGTVTHQNNAPAHQSNRWYHLRWEFKWSTGSDGYCRLFVDGVQTFSFNGPTADGSGQYFKLGQNRWPSGSGNMKTTSVCYYDNLKIYTRN